MVAQNSILQRCFEEAASSSARALERCVDEAILSLQAEEAGAIKVIVRDRLALAWNSLLKQRSNLAASLRGRPARRLPRRASGRRGGADAVLICRVGLRFVRFCRPDPGR
jgi:hypothetical protein